MSIAAPRLTAPSRATRSLCVAAVLGFALPAIVASLIALAAYYPIGSGLPESSVKTFVNAFGVGLAILIVTAGAAFAGAIYALVVRRWRPVALLPLFAFCVLLGLLPGLALGGTIKSWAFELFSRRSMVLVDAIERYTLAIGKPPESLSDLVPTYLAAVPKTGMAAYPDYEYETAGEGCSVKNKWSLRVDVSEFIDMNQMLYCPAQDYERAKYPILSRTRMGAWVHDRIDF